MNELVRGAGLPLFDRLAQSATTDSKLLASPQQLEISIGRELVRLFNTRSRIPLRSFDSAYSTLDYGIPDFTALSPRSTSDLHKLQMAIAHAIHCFEPRLKNVSVRAFAATKEKAAAVVISGEVTIEMKLQPLSFELQLDARHGGLAKMS
jgi:type VI secretion system protein ImpF